MKDQLVFDVTDSDTIADSDSVGAYVRSDDGTLITHHTISGSEHLDVYAALAAGDGTPITQTGGALDINIASSDITFDIDLDGVYNVGTNPNPDNVGIISHTRAGSIGDAQQVERTTAGGLGSIASASLGNVNALDTNAFLMAINDTSGDAEQLTIDNTTGGLEVYIAGSDALTVNDAALANTDIASAANPLTAAGVAEDVVVSPLANRKYLFIYNNGNRRIFVGESGVTAANGFPLAPRSYLELRAGAAIDIEWVGPNTSQNIRTLELS